MSPTARACSGPLLTGGFAAMGDDTIDDGEEDYAAWIECRNASDQIVSLEGWFRR
jgi:hypothetical protein